MAEEEGGDGKPSVNVVIEDNGQYSVAVRALWFIFVGWWASGIWLGVAWLLNVSIVGLPLGIKMINKTPQVLSLRTERKTSIVTQTGEDISYTESGPDQPSFVLRAVYFVLIGWWASAVWMSLAWLASVTVVGLPLAIWMYNRLPYVTSLYRFS